MRKASQRQDQGRDIGTATRTQIDPCLPLTAGLKVRRIEQLARRYVESNEATPRKSRRVRC